MRAGSNAAASTSSDPWQATYEQARDVADDMMAGIHERNDLLRQNKSTARHTAVLRRKLGVLSSHLTRLESLVASSSSSSTSLNEKTRRRDLIAVLTSRRNEMDGLMSTTTILAVDKASLLATSTTLTTTQAPKIPLYDQNPSAHETDRTASLENNQLLALQRRMMNEQDESLDDLAKTARGTKQLALAIHNELDLHVRLLDDLQTDVQTTHTRIEAAGLRLGSVLRLNKRATWTCGTFLVLLGLLALLALIVKH